jgi:hypothetical protein
VAALVRKKGFPEAWIAMSFSRASATVLVCHPLVGLKVLSQSRALAAGAKIRERRMAL